MDAVWRMVAAAEARAPWPGGLDSPIVAALREAANNNPAAWADARGRAAGMFAGHERGQALADDAPAIGAFKPSPAMIPWVVGGGRRILVRAGNRVGKSRHAAARLVAAALTHPGGLYRAVGVTFKQAARVVGKLLHEFIPPRAIRRGSHYDSARGWRDQLIRLTNGAEIEIRSYDQEQTAHAGNPLDGVWLDEPPPQPIFTENQTRLTDRNGWMLVTCTPAGYPLKWFRELVATSPFWREFVIPFDHRSCPWYSAERIAEVINEARFMPSTFAQRIEGAWEGVTIGRFFAGFEPEQHVKGRDRGLASPSLRWRLGLDHGQGANREVGILSAIRTVNGACKAVHVAREFKSGAGLMGAREIAVGIKAALCDVCEAADLELDALLGRLEIYGDSNAAGLGKAGRYNDEIMAELRAVGIHNPIRSPVKVQGAREDCEALINSLAIRGGLTVDPTCILTLDGLNHYVQGKEAHKDAIDALRYGLYDLLTSRPTGPKLFRA